jgi:hypothetical protein
MKIQPKGSRLAIAAIGVLAFGAASAASLGGLSSTDIGSSDTVVASCDSDGVSVKYITSYSAATSQYEVTTVKLSGIDAACANQVASVTVKDAGGNALASGSATVASTSESIPLSAPVSAESVVGASVVISG